VYDIDIFIRFFSDKHKPLADLLESILKSRFKRIHGSRDYFQLRKGDILIEAIPVLKINAPKEAENVTDLSYFHVNYVLDKIRKHEKLKDEIIIAKNFCYAQNFYGAEGYIKGFSGYALELLLCHYQSFLKFIQAVASLKEGEKIIIDDSHFYRDKESLFEELNEAKQQSPIIVIDPTFKERNALSGLSPETFNKFKSVCEKFLQNPSKKFFEVQNVEDEFKDMKSVVKIAVMTTKQAGDISGTKSKKFFDFFVHEAEKEFIVKRAEFDYKEKENKAYFYLVVEKKKEELVRGPSVNFKKNAAQFKRAHPDAFEKQGFMYVKKKHDLSFPAWLEKFQHTYKKVISEMDIRKIDLC
jgi:tRNA nucleotidyltransferase (CCA-adding enzyme)